jgi:hypothetical protein
MKVDVYDTYATSAKGAMIHFDVLVPMGTSAETAFKFAREWLDQVGMGDAELEQTRCNFCHSENAGARVIIDVEQDGYHIIRMEGCPTE